MSKTDPSWNRLLSHEKQELHFGGIFISINDGVFTPDPTLTYSTSMVIENLPPLDGFRVADVGTGSGVIAVIAALRGAKEVVATDISEEAVQNAVINVQTNGVVEKVKVIKTDLLDGVVGKFDVICANLPILNEVWKSQRIDVVSIIDKFLDQAKVALSSNGKIYIPWASFAKDVDLEACFKKHGYRFNRVDVEKLGYLWYLYILEY